MLLRRVVGPHGKMVALLARISPERYEATQSGSQFIEVVILKKTVKKANANKMSTRAKKVGRACQNLT